MTKHVALFLLTLVATFALVTSVRAQALPNGSYSFTGNGTVNVTVSGLTFDTNFVQTGVVLLQSSSPNKGTYSGKVTLNVRVPGVPVPDALCIYQVSGTYNFTKASPTLPYEGVGTFKNDLVSGLCDDRVTGATSLVSSNGGSQINLIDTRISGASINAGQFSGTLLLQ